LFASGLPAVSDECVHVVAGILRDAHGRVLLAQRPHGKHLAGLWEFPGGKCEPGESPEQALRRELHEEIGVQIGAISRLIAVPWCYPQKSILLDVYEIADYAGNVHGREAQALQWVRIEDLPEIPMPPADRPVMAALRLPPHYVISGEPGAGPVAFLDALRTVLDAGEKCVQLRSKHLPQQALRELGQGANALTRSSGAQLLLNDDAALAQELGCGVHLPAIRLMQLERRPLPAEFLVAASCHDERELEQASVIGVDFAVLGPVRPTPSHPHAAPLGWERFAQLCAQAPFPVYALGGMTPRDFSQARAAGAQGVAGISGFWPALSG
jgi:8-oxo-dGTP diphosphatase